MKKYLILSAILFSGFSLAQIGLNTSEPKTTFDITAKTSTGTSTLAEGLLAPRIDRQRAQSMMGTETSDLVYINDISTGSLTGTAINIDKTGFYYFDGTVWKKLNNNGTIPVNTNIFKNNGTLTQNRIVSQTDKSLQFTGNVNNSFSVDDTTFSIDASSHKIGIGTKNPIHILVIKGTNAQPTSTNGTLRVDGNSNHTLDFGTFSDEPFGSYISTFDKTNSVALPLILNPFGSNVGIATSNPSSNAVLDLFATDKGFLPPRLSMAQRDAINPKVAGLMIYNTTNHCMENWDTQKWVSKCANFSLNCAGATHNGTLKQGVSASNVSTVISYTGGNGSAYSAQTISSNGLTATLSSGNFANGNGTLTFIITGTPTSVGNVNFTFTINGITCTFTRTVTANVPPNPDSTIGCTGWSVKGFGTYNGSVNGTSFTATVTKVSGEIINYGSSVENTSCNGQTRTMHNVFYFTMPTATSRGVMTIKFNRDVSNVKFITGLFISPQNYILKIKRKGVLVSPTYSVLGSCYVFAGGGIIGALNTTGGGISAINVGGQWFDEIEIIGNRSSSDNPIAGSSTALQICVGAAQ